MKRIALYNLACISMLLICFTLAQADTSVPIFSESFESLAEVIANGATSHDNLTFEPGKVGNGVLITGNANLIYPAGSRFNFQKGTVEFWFKPNWDGSSNLNGKLKYFFKIEWGSTQSVFAPVYFLDKVNMFMPQFNDQGTHDRLVRGVDVMQWKSGDWHKVMVFWDFTLPDNSDGTHNSYLVLKLDDRYSSFANFAPVGPEAMSSGARIIIGQDHVLGRYPADGIIDEFKIYDTSLLPVVPFPQYQYNPFYPETETTFRKLFENDGFCSPFENYNNQPNDCPKLEDSIRPGESIFFFQKPAFERVYENYVPKETEINTQFNYQAAPGEYETLFFNAYSRIDLNNVRITYTDFQGSSATIPKANLNLKVVKNWFQGADSSSTVPNQLPSYVPELLLNNDQVPLETDQSLNIIANKLPSLPILDHVETKVNQFTSKQFAMVVKVPETTPAGIYASTLTFTADNLPAQMLKMNLEVLPFTLRDSGKINSLWYSFDEHVFDSAGTTSSQDDYTRKYFTDIKNHGFDTIFFYDSQVFTGGKFDQLSREVKMAADAGMKRVILYITDPTKITTAYRDLLTSNGFEPWFYGFDEIGETSNHDYGMVDHIKKSIVIHSIGGKVVTAATKEAADRLENPNDPIYTANFPAGTLEPLDWAIYPGASQGVKNPNRLEAYYWQSRDENPQTNRSLCGYYLWDSNRDACTPTYYMTRTGKDYYNDFDYFDPPAIKARPYMLAYPTIEGMVTTFQWEATREGVDDIKYVATWKYYKDEAAKTNPDLAQQSEVAINSVLEHYQDGGGSILPGWQRNSMSQYDSDRKTIVDEILQLKLYLDLQAIPYGDVSGDGTISAYDAALCAQAAVGLITLTDDQKKKADVSGDGNVSAYDAALIAQRAVGLISKFPIE